MILAAHQPDLFPYAGFWVKMARADLFDLAIFDQFQRKGYQRRVTMRGEWAQVLVIRASAAGPISEVRLHPTAPDRLIDTVKGRYRGAPMWWERGQMVLDWIDGARSDLLWLFNLSLIVKVRDFLQIETPVSVASAPIGAGLDGLVDICGRYWGVDTYLSGDGGRAYMGPDPEAEFHRHGLRLHWMNYVPPSPDSILSILFDEEFPRKVLFA